MNNAISHTLEITKLVENFDNEKEVLQRIRFLNTATPYPSLEQQMLFSKLVNSFCTGHEFQNHKSVILINVF